MKFLFWLILTCATISYTSALLPGGCYITKMPTTRPTTATPSPVCCPPCNYKCPPEQCSCYFPGTKTLIEPRKVQPTNAENCPCAVCFMAVLCPNPPIDCTAEQIKDLIKYDSL